MTGADATADEPATTALTVIAPAATPAMSIVGDRHLVVPAMIADLGDAAALRFLDFFTANIRNPNTSAAYAVAVRGFFRWLEKHSVRELSAVRTHHVSAYVEVLGKARSRRRSSSTWRRSACCSTG